MQHLEDVNLSVNDSVVNDPDADDAVEDVLNSPTHSLLERPRLNILCFSRVTRRLTWLIAAAFLCGGVGILTIVFAVKPFYRYTSFIFGSWWAGIVPVVNTPLPMMYMHRATLLFSAGLCVFALLVSAAALALDALGLSLFLSLNSCAAVDRSFVGESEGFERVAQCKEQAEQNGGKHRCFCTTRENFCIELASAQGSGDCSDVLNNHPTDLAVVIGLHSINCILLIICCYLTCAAWKAQTCKKKMHPSAGEL